MGIPPRALLERPFYIHGDAWDVLFVKKLPDNKTDTLGLCDFSTRTIYIKEGLSNAQAFATFIHEYLHAYESYGLKVSHNAIYRLEDVIFHLFIEF